MLADEIIDIKEISTLLIYLRMNEDNFVVYDNGLAKLKVGMIKDYHLKCTNLNFPELPELNFDEQWSVRYMLGVIDNLKQIPATGDLADLFKSEWDKISAQVSTMLGLNHQKISKCKKSRISNNGSN